MLVAPLSLHAAEPYVTDSIFINIDDVNREAEAWAVCSASYELLSKFVEEKEATSKVLLEKSNGAKMAVVMSIVFDKVDRREAEDFTVKEFNATWSYSKLAMQSLPESKMASIMADAERLSAAGQIQQFVDNLTDTIEICQRNSDGQQMYIDFWRELAKSGLLTTPD